MLDNANNQTSSESILPREGDIVQGGPWDGFEVISVYSRAQALDDGVLVDVTPIAKKCGFRIHTVITCGVKAALCEGKPEDFNLFETVSWLLLALHAEIKKADESTDTIHFKHAGLDLWSLVGPGDTAAPVLTIMLEGED